MYQSRRRGASDAKRAEALRSLQAQGASFMIETGWPARRLRAAARMLRGVRAAVIEGFDMHAMEPARAVALDGADLLLWARPARSDRLMDVARTRAFENRVFVLVCSSAEDVEPACLIGPDGNVIASALRGRPNGFSCSIDVARAREKSVVWGTDAFADRCPSAYDLYV